MERMAGSMVGASERLCRNGAMPAFGSADRLDLGRPCAKIFAPTDCLPTGFTKNSLRCVDALFVQDSYAVIPCKFIPEA